MNGRACLQAARRFSLSMRLPLVLFAAAASLSNSAFAQTASQSESVPEADATAASVDSEAAAEAPGAAPSASTQADSPASPVPAPSNRETEAGPTRASTSAPATNARRTSGSAPAREPAADSQAEPEQSSRGAYFYLRLQGGVSFANLVAFSDENFVPESDLMRGSGGVGGLAFGVRFWIFSLGVQATYARQGDFDLGTAGVEFALHLPIPIISPYFRLGLGYAWVDRADVLPESVRDVDIFGLEVELGLGLDIKLGRTVSLGAGVDAVFLNLSRQEFGNFRVLMVNLEEDGDAVGLAVRGQVRLTFTI